MFKTYVNQFILVVSIYLNTPKYFKDVKTIKKIEKKNLFNIIKLIKE
jgi:uncharacterized membrane protein